jgi:hypothetical protein
MKINILFIVLVFIVMIAIVLLSNNLTTAVLLVSVIANIIIMSSPSLGKNFLSLNATEWGETPEDPEPVPEVVIPEPEPVPEPTAPFEGDQSTNMYGMDHEKYHGYHTAYTDCYPEVKPVIAASCSERDLTMDGANAFMAQKRSRDKKVMDGVASKTSAYYRQHYAEELDEEEAKPWWGQSSW